MPTVFILLTTILHFLHLLLRFHFYFFYLRENKKAMYRLLIILFLFPLTLCAQETTDSLVSVPQPRYEILEELQGTNASEGNILLNHTPAIANLLKWHIHTNEQQKTFSGFRIQIHSVNSYGCNLEELKEIRNKFEQNFPDIPAYLKYFDPDFKIRVGNFHSRLECIPTLHRIRKLYPASYPVKTEISLEELKRIPMQDIPVTEEQN